MQPSDKPAPLHAPHFKKLTNHPPARASSPPRRHVRTTLPIPTPPARASSRKAEGLSGTHSVTRPPSGMGPGQSPLRSDFRDDARGWDDARWKGGGRPSPQPAMPRLRGDKIWRQRFFLPRQPIVFLRFGIISPTFFAGKYSPLPSLPLQFSPSLSREPDAHRVFGRAAETSPFGLGTRRPEGPRQAGGAGSAGRQPALPALRRSRQGFCSARLIPPPIGCGREGERPE